MSDRTLSRRQVLAAGGALVGAVGEPGAVAAAESMQDAKREDPPPSPQLQRPIYGPPTYDHIEKPSRTREAVAAFNRPQKDADAWEAFKQRLRSEGRLTSDGLAYSPLAETFADISKGFSFRADPEDVAFSPLHVEPLIDQAADLLDRGIKDRSEWDDLGAKYLELLLSLHEFADLDEIHKNEDEKGLYEQPWWQSYTERVGEFLALDVFNKVHNELYSLWNEHGNAKAVELRHHAAQLNAWLSGRVPYIFKNQPFERYTAYTWKGKQVENSEHLRSAAELLNWFDQINWYDQTWIQTAINRSNLEVAAVKNDSATVRYDWDAFNSVSQRLRTATARKYNDTKLNSAMSPDGILNRGKRLVSIKQRFERDFRDGLARLKAVEAGMKTLYGYTVALPTNETAREYFDDCLLWVRNSIQWLLRLSRLEQNAAIPVSVSHLIGNQQFVAQGKSGAWTIELDVAHPLFASMRCVRLRGINVYVEGKTIARPWNLTIGAPAEGSVKHLDGSVHKLDQKMVAAVTSSRVLATTDPRQPDLLGMQTLFNASPFGRWNVRLNPSLASTQNAAQLSDIRLDLHLAFVSR